MVEIKEDCDTAVVDDREGARKGKFGKNTLCRGLSRHSCGKLHLELLSPRRN